MKKCISFIAMVLCALTAGVCCTACGTTTHWVEPDFYFDKDGYSVELVTNLGQNVDMPVSGLELRREKFDNERILQYKFLIYDSDHNLIGWIEDINGYDVDKKGNYTIGYCTSVGNGVTAYWGSDFTIVLKSNDLSIFDQLTVTTSCGNITRRDPMPATQRYVDYNTETGETTPAAGSENYVCCSYTLNLHELDWKTVADPQISITPKEGSVFA